MSGLRVGLVGAGMVAEHHVEGWRRCAGARLVGVADPDPRRAAERARQAGISAYQTMEDLIRSELPDAVDIVAPPDLHGPLIAEALAAGCHVLCQKPLAPTLAEARQIVRELPGHPRMMVHENWRWRAPYRAMKAALISGEASRPRSFEFRVESSGLLAREDGLFPALVRQPFFAGLKRFLVIEVLVHHLDVLSFLLGPLIIEGAALDRRSPAIAGEDFARVRLSAGGVPGVLTGDFCRAGAPDRPSDTLDLEAPEHPSVRGWTASVGGRDLCAVNAGEGYAESYAATIAHFVECLASGDAFETGPEQAVSVLEAVETIYQMSEWR